MPTWLEVILSLVETACIVVGSCAAIKGLNTWRKELVHKRKSELAEEVLSSFYEIRDVFNWVRFPASYSSEGETRPTSEDETQNQAQARRNWYVPVERLTSHTELFSRTQSLKYRFIAYFGSNAEAPFRKVKEIHDKILTSAGMLIRTEPRDDRGSLPQNVQDLRDRCEENIGWFLDEDPLAPLIEEAIQDIENLCQPYLSS